MIYTATQLDDSGDLVAVWGIGDTVSVVGLMDRPPLASFDFDPDQALTLARSIIEAAQFINRDQLTVEADDGRDPYMFPGVD